MMQLDLKLSWFYRKLISFKHIKGKLELSIEVLRSNSKPVFHINKYSIYQDSY